MACSERVAAAGELAERDDQVLSEMALLLSVITGHSTSQHEHLNNDQLSSGFYEIVSHFLSSK